MTRKKPVDDLVEAIGDQIPGDDTAPDETPSIGEVVGTISEAVAAVVEERTPELWGKFRVSLESRDREGIQSTAQRLGLDNPQIKVAAAALDDVARFEQIIGASEGTAAELQEINAGLVLAYRIKPTSVDQAEQVAKDILALEKRDRQVKALGSACKQAERYLAGAARVAPELFGIIRHGEHRLPAMYVSPELGAFVRKELDQDPRDDWLAYGRKPTPRRRARLVTRRSK